MPRRKGRSSTGAKQRGSSRYASRRRAPVRSTSGSSRTRQATGQTPLRRSKRDARRRRIRTTRHRQGPRQTGAQGLLAGLRDGRTGMHESSRGQQGPTAWQKRATRLSSALVPLVRKDARRPDRKRACSANKARRRSIVIATGHGGRNGIRNYREHRSCR